MNTPPTCNADLIELGKQVPQLRQDNADLRTRVAELKAERDRLAAVVEEVREIVDEACAVCKDSDPCKWDSGCIFKLFKEALAAAPPAAKCECDTLCVECGPNVKIDEDGCCVGCGRDAIGHWLNDHRNNRVVVSTSQTPAKCETCERVRGWGERHDYLLTEDAYQELTDILDGTDGGDEP